MRLICPNCGAQYEVGDDVIPEAGRDVQCSNCGNTWFETPGASLALEAGDDHDAPPPAPQPAPPPTPSAAEQMPEPKPMPEPEALPEPEPEPEAMPEPELEPEAMPEHKPEPEAMPDPEPEKEPDPEAISPPIAPRRTVSPEIARILQEEAERERTNRAAEAQSGLESQPDLGLEAPLDRDDQLAEEARRRMARMRGEAAPAIGAAVTAAAGTRRELLPDIEEINSSLRSTSDRQTPEEYEDQVYEQAVQKRGSRFGFTLIVAIFALLALLYVLAPRIIAAAPQTAPVLEPYVASVNSGRLWLDRQMQNLLVMLEGDDAAPEAAPAEDPAAVPETVPGSDG